MLFTGGLIHMLCEGAKQYGELRLNYRQLATVIDSIHNYCYGSDAGGKQNKEDVLQHYYRPLRAALLGLST